MSGSRATGAAAPAACAPSAGERERERPGRCACASSASPSGASGAFAALAACLLWMVSLLALLVTNKVVLPSLRYPLSVSCWHFCVCSWGTAGLAIFRPREELRSEAHAWKVVLLASLVAASIASNNLAFETLALGYLEVIANATPVATAATALALQGRMEDWATYAALVPVAVGVSLTSSFESSFAWMGFLAAATALLLRALKGVFASMLMTDAAERLDPLSLLSHSAPVCAALLLPAAAALEPGFFPALAERARTDRAFAALWCANGVLAFAVNVFNFLVTFHTSALTLQVLGVLKSSVAMLLSVYLFHAPIGAEGVLGYLCSVVGVLAYFECKRRFPARTLEQPPCLPSALKVASEADGKVTSKGCGHTQLLQRQDSVEEGGVSAASFGATLRKREVDYVPLPQGPPGGGAAPHSVSVPSLGIGLGLVTACRRTAVLLGLGAGFALSLSELRMIAIFSEAP